MNDLIPKHGGYRKLKSFQIAQLIYDLTVKFCEKYIDKFSRTRDQMTQAARSGVQNIAEGSQASATSKKTEIKLTNVARASLEELKLDYEDFLRHNNFPLLKHNDPILVRFKSKKCKSLSEIQVWVKEEKSILDKHRQTQTNKRKKTVIVSESPCKSNFSSSALAANAALSLLNLCSYLLSKQINSLAESFKNEGGFTERLYHYRKQHRFDWKVKKTAYALNEKWIKVRSDMCISPNGEIIDPYYVIEYSDWINVFGLTVENEVVLVRQYRHGIGKTLIELPSGTVEKGENPVETAKRELLEETGYSGRNFKVIGRVCPNTSNHKNYTYSIFANGLEKIADPIYDETEIIEPVILPYKKVIQMAKDGVFQQALHVSTIFFSMCELGKLNFG